jgi:hypothetical protein
MKYVVTKISVGRGVQIKYWFHCIHDMNPFLRHTCHFLSINCWRDSQYCVFKTGPNCFISITFSNFNYILYFSYFHFSLNLCNVQLVMALFLKLKGKENCQLYFISISIVLVFGLPPAAGFQVSHTSHWVTTTCSKPSVVSLKPCFWIHFTVVFPNK